MGATDVCLSAIWHHVNFRNTSVSFVFKPLQYRADVLNAYFLKGHFTDKAGADIIKQDIDKALKFIDFLKEFEKTFQNKKTRPFIF